MLWGKLAGNTRDDGFWSAEWQIPDFDPTRRKEGMCTANGNIRTRILLSATARVAVLEQNKTTNKSFTHLSHKSQIPGADLSLRRPRQDAQGGI